MPRHLKALFVLFSLWLLTGLYIVGGDERGVVRRFGRATTDADGRIVLRASGLHFDWPWPFSRVDRVNLAEIRTLSVPFAGPTADPSQLLKDPNRPHSTFLTGDKNLLDVRLTVHYRIASAGVKEYLFGSADVDERLSCLVECVTADVLSRSGVDFVQVSGLTELRGLLARLLQEQTDRQQLGVVIEEVVLDEIAPPIAVKADFLDVANARADREQSIQASLSQAEERKQSASAEARRARDEALAEAQEIVQSAQGSAERFRQIIASFQTPESPGAASQSLARRLAMERQYFQAIAEILEKIQGKVFLDTGGQVDLTIWRSTTNGREGAKETDRTEAPPGPPGRD